MNTILPISMCAILAASVIYTEVEKRKRECYESSVIMARPDYKSTITPRFDPLINTGVIRGSAPNIKYTAINSYPITQDNISPSESKELDYQYGLSFSDYSLQKKDYLQASQPCLQELKPDLQASQLDLQASQLDLQASQLDLQELKPDLQELKPDLQELKPDLQELKPDLQALKPNLQPYQLDLQPSLQQLQPSKPDLQTDLPISNQQGSSINPDSLIIQESSITGESMTKESYSKNDPLEKSNFFDKKNKISSDDNIKMSLVLEHIDEPMDIQPSEFSKLGEMHTRKKEQVNSRPDLSYEGAQLPKLGIENKFKDPTNPENYMYDRTLFAPLKRRYGGVGTDYIRGDVYVAPNKFGWFDVPSNPGTDLNPGFFNLNYPSFEQTVENQDLEVKRKNSSLTLSELENIQRNNPFSTNMLHRP